MPSCCRQGILRVTTSLNISGEVTVGFSIEQVGMFDISAGSQLLGIGDRVTVLPGGILNINGGVISVSSTRCLLLCQSSFPFLDHHISV